MHIRPAGFFSVVYTKTPQGCVCTHVTYTYIYYIKVNRYRNKKTDICAVAETECKTTTVNKSRFIITQ